MPARYVFVPTEGPVVLFEFAWLRAISPKGWRAITEIRPAKAWLFLRAGPLVEKRAGQWAAEVADLVQAPWRRQQAPRARSAATRRRPLPWRSSASSPHEGEGVDGVRAADQVAGRDRADGRLDCGLRDRHGADARGAGARHHREPSSGPSCTRPTSPWAANGSRPACSHRAAAPTLVRRNPATASSGPASWSASTPI